MPHCGVFWLRCCGLSPTLELGGSDLTQCTEPDRIPGMAMARPGDRSLCGFGARHQHDSGALALWRERGCFGSRAARRGGVLVLALGTRGITPRHAAHGLCC